MHESTCLRACNRRQVRLATNKEADGLEIVRNWIQELSEDVRRGRLQHYADITEEGEPGEDEIGLGECVPDVRHGLSHVQSEPGRTTILDGSVIERSNRFLNYAWETTSAPTRRIRSIGNVEWNSGTTRILTWTAAP